MKRAKSYYSEKLKVQALNFGLSVLNAEEINNLDSKTFYVTHHNRAIWEANLPLQRSILHLQENNKLNPEWLKALFSFIAYPVKSGVIENLITQNEDFAEFVYEKKSPCDTQNLKRILNLIHNMPNDQLEKLVGVMFKLLKNGYSNECYFKDLHDLNKGQLNSWIEIAIKNKPDRVQYFKRLKEFKKQIDNLQDFKIFSPASISSEGDMNTDKENASAAEFLGLGLRS